MFSRWIGAAVVAAVLAACAPKTTEASGESSPVAPATSATTIPETATVAEVHAALIIPGSDVLFKAESEPPADDAGWREVAVAAHKVIDGAHELQRSSRARDAGDWVRIAKAVEENAVKSVAAAEARDSEALLFADGDFLVHCEDCHKFYRDAGGGMMANPNR